MTTWITQHFSVCETCRISYQIQQYIHLVHIYICIVFVCKGQQAVTMLGTSTEALQNCETLTKPTRTAARSALHLQLTWQWVLQV